MQIKPIVSVCMITYGHEKFIEKAINGVLMQKCNFNVELLLVNDNSPDDTDKVVQNILKKHKNSSWINYIKNDKNLGMMPNFIFALKQCKYKYIAICEGDDYWTDLSKLQKQIDFLEQNSNYVLTFHKATILKINGTIVKDYITKVPTNHEKIEDLAQFGNYIHTPTVVFKNCVKEFPKEFELSPIGDYFLYMILAQYGKFKYIKDTMAVYREGVGYWSSKTYYQKCNNTNYAFVLLYNYFSKLNLPTIKLLLKDRILNMMQFIENDITKADILKISINDELNKDFIIYFSNRIKKINKETIGDKIKVLFFKIKSKLWKKIKI